MEIKNNLSSNALRKIAMLILKASDLGMDVSGYGYADENRHSGNVYLWLEDYDFTLYIGLGSDTVYANWVSPEDGREEDTDTSDMSLYELQGWASALNLNDEENDDDDTNQ